MHQERADRKPETGDWSRGWTVVESMGLEFAYSAARVCHASCFCVAGKSLTPVARLHSGRANDGSPRLEGEYE